MRRTKLSPTYWVRSVRWISGSASAVEPPSTTHENKFSFLPDNIANIQISWSSCQHFCHSGVEAISSCLKSMKRSSEKQPTGNNNIEIDLLIYVCDRLASVPQERRDKTASAEFLAHLVNNLC